MYGRHVVVHPAVNQEQAALETGGVGLRRLDRVVVGAVRILHERSLIPLAPVVFVLTLIVIAGLGDPDLEEIVERRAQQRVGGDESAARVAPHRGLLDVDPRETLRELLHAGDLIRESCCDGPSRRNRRR